MNSDAAVGLLYLLAFAWIYLLPAFIAHSHHRRNRAAITILNVLLGWTLLGWVVALVWAAMVDDDGGEIRIER